jgi:predicted HD phosphohydrolase
MTTDEAAAFEANPLFALHLKMRAWDEQAKLENEPLPYMTKYKEMVERLLS